MAGDKHMDKFDKELDFIIDHNSRLNTSEKYEIYPEEIGSGSFGYVFQARNKCSNDYVAMKLVKKSSDSDMNEMLRYSALREISILRSLKNENVVALKEVCILKKNDFSQFYAVLELCTLDLLTMRENFPLSEQEKKCIVQQMFQGLLYLIIHRDMKSPNILVNRQGIIKLADFGQARVFEEKENSFSSAVVSLCYRPIELLLGLRNYGPGIDVWGAACIMAEIYKNDFLFMGNTQESQVKAIEDLCGPITENVWPEVQSLPNFAQFSFAMASDSTDSDERSVREKLVKICQGDELAGDFLHGLLTYDPKKRPTSEAALQHEFFKTGPLPATNLAVTMARILEEEDPQEEQSNNKKRKRRERKRNNKKRKSAQPM